MMRDLLRPTYYIIAVYRGTDPHGRYRPTITLEGTRFADLDSTARVLAGALGDGSDGRYSSVELCGYTANGDTVPVVLRRYGISSGLVSWQHPALRNMVQGEVFA